MKRVINFLREHFSYTRKERNGITVLLIILLTLISIPYFSNFFAEEDTVDYTAFLREIQEFEKTSVRKAGLVNADYTEQKVKPELFPFDPNGLPEEQWTKLGLSRKQIRVIKNYENKGGKFTRKEDLKKIYGITAEDYQRLLPYISLQQSKTYTSETAEQVSAPLKMLELNTADSLALLGLPGIGPAFASRIIKYRIKLGGFHHPDQLQEVYGMDSVRFNTIKDRVWADVLILKKILLNTATFEGLKHPYLDYKTIRAILNYRDQHGPFKTVAELRNIISIDKKFIIRIEPYLELQ